MDKSEYDFDFENFLRKRLHLKNQINIIDNQSNQEFHSNKMRSDYEQPDSISIEENLNKNFFGFKKFNQNRFGKQLFLNNEDEDNEPNLKSIFSQYSEFNSDTKLNVLGGLTIWQLTAIIIAFIIVFGKKIIVN